MSFTAQDGMMDWKDAFIFSPDLTDASTTTPGWLQDLWHSSGGSPNGG
jgi:hypothetical protein